MRNQVTRVPKRRPPSPHSCSRSRSPLRQRAAAKPSQVMRANSATKMIKAVQFTSCTAFLPGCPCYLLPLPRLAWCSLQAALVIGCEVDSCGQDGPDDDPKELV